MAKKFFTAFLIIGLVAGTFSFSAAAQMVKPDMCPVMPGERVREKFFVDYQGKRIYLCCRNCVKAFKRNPEKYMKRLREA